MRLLVTGGAGFIGSHIVDELLRRGYEVLILDNLATGNKANINSKANFVSADISDLESIKKYFEGVEAVFHCGALARIQPSIQDPIKAHQANATGTLNVLWAAHLAGVKKLVYSASSSVYGDQPPENYPLTENLGTNITSPYGVSKLIGEYYCRLFSKLYQLPTVSLRYFNVYGPRQLCEGSYATVIGIFLKQREKGESMTIVGDGEQRRDYTHVRDVVRANIAAWEREIPGGEVINIGTGRNYSVNEIARMIGGPTVNVPQRLGEYRITVANITKAQKLLGWQPEIKLEDAIIELKELHGLSG